MSGDHRKAIAEEGLFQGKPSLTLKWRADSQYPFSFGVTKAQLIVACFDEIKAFVAAHPEGGGGGRNNRPTGPRRQNEALTDRQDAPLGERPGLRHHGGSPEERHGYTPPTGARPGAGDDRRPGT